MDNTYQNTIQTWRKLAEVYHKKFKDIRIYDASYAAFASCISSYKPSILEIGCGPGTATSWLRNRLPNAQILATDVAKEMIELAQSHIPGVHFDTLGARNVSSLTETFDAIFSGFCIPYLEKEDLTNFVRAIASKLNKQGIVYMSCIEGDYSNSQLQTGSTGDSMKIHFYQESDLLS